MARILVFEDEPAALNRLKRLIKQINPDYSVVADADSLEEGEQLINKLEYDLIIADIQLADGLSFEILKNLKKPVPIIFVTAYNQYALDAFEYGGLHYLLKPIEAEKLNEALKRYENYTINNSKVNDVLDFLKARQKESSKNILSKVGKKIQVVDIANVAYAYLDNGISKLVNFEAESFPVDYSIEQLMNKFSTNKFFQINRQMIINISAVEEMLSYTSSRIKLKLKPSFKGEAVVSKEKTPLFKQWVLEADF